MALQQSALPLDKIPFVSILKEISEFRMLSHIHVGVTDFDKAFAFYEAVLGRLGLEVRFKDVENSWAGWQQPGKDRPLFLIGHPYDGNRASPGNGSMTAFTAPDRASVMDCHAIALRMGGVDEGIPGLRPGYHPHYYGCYFRDPDGNKLCVVCHTPASVFRSGEIT